MFAEIKSDVMLAAMDDLSVCDDLEPFQFFIQ